MEKKVFREGLYKEYGQTFNIDEVLFEHKTGHQELIIFRNKQFGHVMALDGIIQTTERDEFIYHEMLTHVPLVAHPMAKKVLIIGGGDGGILREVVKHQNIESITQVEIDQAVIDMCQQYFPGHSDGAFNDPRVRIEIADGAEYVKTCNDRFDIIISDSTDPIGPGESLFSTDFYRSQVHCLSDNGILVAQNGVPFMQLDEVITSYQRLSPLYTDMSFFCAPVPTYIGGLMTLVWASNNASYRQLSFNEIQSLLTQKSLRTQYYNAEIHCAAFALPQYVKNALQQANNNT